MSHTKKATILLPALRPDEQEFVSDSGAKINAREITFAVDDGPSTTVDIPLSQPSLEIPGIPGGAVLSFSVANKTENGEVGHSNDQVVQAPPATHPVPVPDASQVTFTDEEDPAPTPTTTQFGDTFHTVPAGAD